MSSLFARWCVDKTIDTLIKPPVQKFVGCDDALRQRTQEKRAVAEKIRARSQRVDSGSSAGDLLRMVK